MSPLAAGEMERISGSVHCQTNIYTSLGQGKGPTIRTCRAYWGQLFKQNSQGGFFFKVIELVCHFKKMGKKST